MVELISVLPFSFWVAIALLMGGGIWAVQKAKDAIGLPMLAVLGTVAAWYVGDAFYNDYAHHHVKLFNASTLSGAWWQVAWFLAVFLAATPEIHRRINGRLSNQRSGVLQLLKHGVGYPEIQRQLGTLFTGCVIIWLVLLAFALIILRGEVIYYLLPILGYKANPWSHNRIGAGFDAFSVLAVYLQLLSASMFGVVAALATNRRIRWLAIFFCLLSWPNFIFDRTRNTMLAMVIPGVLSWVFLRLRGGLWKKVLVLLLCFCVVNVWMKFIIANRSDMSITNALKEKGFDLASDENVHNEGLNMFEELCWISTFIDKGTYHVNWGKRYFAELVNPIPRGLWPGKPLIGIDYAIARGQGGADASAAGVYATISTGLIGQGVVNFGRLLGPIAAALLMSLWVAWLARMDLTIAAIGHLPLYCLGLILTFNLGRDITLITLYPFVFGALAAWWIGRYHLANPAPVPASSPRPASPARSTTAKALPFAWRKTRLAIMKRPARGRMKSNPPAKPRRDVRPNSP